MKCKICGGYRILETPTFVQEHENHVKESMEEMKDWTCEQLTAKMVNTIMSFKHEAARRILLDRGHVEDI